MEDLIPPHGGYQNLAAYQMAEVVYDATVVFTKLYLDPRSRTVDQMVQAARSGRQNIAEGSVASGTSKKIELKLVGNARASQEELLIDYQDFLRQNALAQWDKNHEKALFIRNRYKKGRSYSTYRTYIEEKGPENAANAMICLVNQTTFLLDRLLKQLEQAFVEEGGFTERLYRVRTQNRNV